LESTHDSALFAEIVQIFSDVLNVPREALNPRSSPENVATWDSVRHLNLVLSVEEKYGVEFEPDEWEGLTELGGFVSLLERKLSQRS
jgi:acyl carrier protein